MAATSTGGFIEGAMTTMSVFKRLTAVAVTIFALMAGAGVAMAGLGQPSPWQLGLQQSATPVMDDIIWFHNILLWTITAIAGFVLLLLAGSASNWHNGFTVGSGVEYAFTPNWIAAKGCISMWPWG